MNVITVDTPVGRTETATVHEIVPQGSGGAALASALDLALGLKRYFAGSQDEICYGRVRTQPQAWQDDVLRIAENVKSTRAGNAKLSTMSTEKGLKAHDKKTTFVIIGTKKYREETEKEVSADPVMFGRLVCQPSESEVYLGEVIHSRGLEAGVEATINSRRGYVQSQSPNRGLQAAGNSRHGGSLDIVGTGNHTLSTCWLWQLDWDWC